MLDTWKAPPWFHQKRPRLKVSLLPTRPDSCQTSHRHRLLDVSTLRHAAVPHIEEMCLEVRIFAKHRAQRHSVSKSNQRDHPNETVGARDVEKKKTVCDGDVSEMNSALNFLECSLRCHSAPTLAKLSGAPNSSSGAFASVPPQCSKKLGPIPSLGQDVT